VTNVPRSKDGAVTVRDPRGTNLKIPMWMVSPEAAEYELSGHAEVDIRALLSLARLLESQKEEENI
jgi:hypothetical protein